MVVILAGGLVPFPGRTAEIADPIIRWTAIPGGIAPDVPVAFWIVARRATLDEPGVLIGCVVWHEVQQNLEPSRMSLRKQIVEIGERSEQRVHIAIVRDVVAKIGHR